VAGVERHGQVLVLGLREALPPQVEETETRDKPSKGKRVRRKD
jgi:hypothetical protein